MRWAVAALSDKPALLLPPARPCQSAPRALAPPPRHRLGLLCIAPGGTGQEHAGGRLRVLPTHPQSSGAHRISQNLYCQQITKVRGPGERTAPQGPAWWAAQAAGLGVRAGDGARPGRHHSPRPGAHLQRLINKQPRRETSGSGEQAGATLPNRAASPMRSASGRGEQLGPAGVPEWGCPGGARMGTRGGASPSIAGAGRAAWEGAEPLGDVGVTGGGIPECCRRAHSHRAASCAGGVDRGREGRAERIGTEQSRLQPLPLNTEAYIRDYDI